MAAAVPGGKANRRRRSLPDGASASSGTRASVLAIRRRRARGLGCRLAAETALSGGGQGRGTIGGLFRSSEALAPQGSSLGDGLVSGSPGIDAIIEFDYVLCFVKVHCCPVNVALCLLALGMSVGPPTDLRTGSPPWLELPEHVWFRVLWSASGEGSDLAWLSQTAIMVCSRWQYLVRKVVFPQLVRVNLTSLEHYWNRCRMRQKRVDGEQGVAAVSDLGIARMLERLFSDCTGARCLVATECYRLVRDSVVHHIRTYPPRLDEMHFSNCALLTDSGVACILKRIAARQLGECTWIHTLTFFSEKLTGESAAEIMLRCPYLQHLEMQYARLDDESLRVLGSLRFLRRLKVRGSEAITDEGMTYLDRLEFLDIALCPQITDRTLFALAQSENLRALLLAHQRYNVWCTGKWTESGVDAVRQAGIEVHFIDV
ncbi:hypothetical protein F1559_000986 [Cyanidiococcus yangmingshanensis]|uniref:Uncharacterized protein n=1 Tax=Cyanidiococcus yangmingshanensis TaxID=2690220 RepID=A0A7J7IKU7_9RHOD|nr:hypothetical protein F1559_000986 [Cyanidiococcus yangmingshanensis]